MKNSSVLAMAFSLTSCLISSLNASNNVLARLESPTQSRLIKVNFFVDDKNLLEKPYLEVSVQENKYAKQQVKLDAASSELATAVSDMSVPQGDVHLSICAMVKCSAWEETELVCGKALIPEALEIFSQHEVTFSTSWVCDGPTAQLARR